MVAVRSLKNEGRFLAKRYRMPAARIAKLIHRHISKPSSGFPSASCAKDTAELNRNDASKNSQIRCFITGVSAPELTWRSDRQELYWLSLDSDGRRPLPRQV